ncbi:MAG: hypothetical protein ACRDNR_13795 [Gaiellaceae bacterium]
MRFPLLVAIILVAGVIAAGFYSASPSARTDVPSIELSVVRDRAQPKRERPARVNREPKRREGAARASGGGAASTGPTPIPAPAPTPAGGGGDDDDDDDAERDDDDGDDGDD